MNGPEHENDETRRQVVAVVVTRRGRVGLFKRSASVRDDAGAWHCITGYLEPERSPLQRAAEELWEETGLALSDLDQLNAGPILKLPDSRGGQHWTVHRFTANTNRRRLTLNWEHDSYRWVRPTVIPRFDGQVRWLSEVLAATTPDLAPRTSKSGPPSSRVPAAIVASVLG
jgi:8-oxo-dGTP pyrophosphatase MutT (NUDIX family)